MFVLTRRRALAGIGVTGVAMGAAGAFTAVQNMPDAGTTVLLDARLSETEQNGLQAVIGDRQTLMLDREVVRQWRSQLAGMLRSNGQLDIIARWDNRTIFAGLAREVGAKFSQIRIGRGIFYMKLIQPR